MKQKSFIYNLINILVLLAAALIFVFNYINNQVFDGMGMLPIIITILAVVLVHSLKAIRLYIALYGADITGSDYIKTYCKVTPISILFPFKLGELFRMYCYGATINNMLKGVVTVILDRFMDTVALVTMIFLVWVVNGGVIMPIVYFLLIFIVAAGVLFMALPGIYKYWKKYLLQADASPRKLKALKFLDNLNKVYVEIANVSRGRGIILYILSLLAWAIEIGSVAAIASLTKGRYINAIISEYLLSALSKAQSVELKHFIFISVVLMIILYLVVKIRDSIIERK